MQRTSISRRDSGLVQPDGSANANQPFRWEHNRDVIGGWLPSLTSAFLRIVSPRRWKSCDHSRHMENAPMLEKIVWKNLPVSVPQEWLKFFDDRSRKLGISRNAAIGLALKLGSPLLDAHVLLMGELIKDNCRKITDQGGAFSEILEPPADLFSMIDGKGDRRKR